MGRFFRWWMFTDLCRFSTDCQSGGGSSPPLPSLPSAAARAPLPALPSPLPALPSLLPLPPSLLPLPPPLPALPSSIACQRPLPGPARTPFGRPLTRGGSGGGGATYTGDGGAAARPSAGVGARPAVFGAAAEGVRQRWQ